MFDIFKNLYNCPTWHTNLEAHTVFLFLIQNAKPDSETHTIYMTHFCACLLPLLEDRPRQWHIVPPQEVSAAEMQNNLFRHYSLPLQPDLWYHVPILAKEKPDVYSSLQLTVLTSYQDTHYLTLPVKGHKNVNASITSLFSQQFTTNSNISLGASLWNEWNTISFQTAT